MRRSLPTNVLADDIKQLAEVCGKENDFDARVRVKRTS
jgi:hypothetical protein